MMGRIMEWMSSDIEGSLQSTKKRKATTEARIIVEGCSRSRIHWLSQMITDDGNSRTSKRRRINNEDAFSWVYESSTGNVSRVATTHKNK